ncbi:MAG: class I SAM-dependent methyltransferase [Deltaproteobacteria bacterium]|nr:class I SAM-dependent methyltransferase [Deltaproteobacteria bacterium]
MGLIFDQNALGFYDTWRQTHQNRVIDKSIEPLVVSLLDPQPGEKVLDIGCGAGNHLIMFSKMGLDISGVDASPQMLEKAKVRLGHKSDFKIGMADDLPFDDNEFDLAVLINTLEFLDNPLSALREAGRVAKKKIFIGVLNSFSWNGFLKTIQGYFGDPLFGQAKLYNLWQLKSLLQLAYGPVPISWQCIRVLPTCLEDFHPLNGDITGWKSPFGFFLGLSATLVYHFQTDNIPLKVRLKTARQPLMEIKALEKTDPWDIGSKQ